MPYGYIGQNTPNQTKSNSGVFSISDVADLEKQGKFGGSLELIEEQTASSDSAINFLSIQENKYNVHFLTTNDIEVGTDKDDLFIRFYESGVEETASVYQYAYQYGFSSGTFGESRTTALSYLRASFDMGTAGNEVSNSQMYFYNLGDSSKYSFQTAHWTQVNSSSVYAFGFGGGVLPQASTVDGIKIYAETGTFSGTIKLYGVKQL